MPLTKDQYNLVVDCLSFLDTDSGRMNNFEREFMASMKERHDQYGQDIRVSDKQMGVMQKLYDKIALGIQPKWAK